MPLLALLSIFATFLLIPFSAMAGCSSIAELRSSKLYIDISDGGCGELSVSFTTKIGKDGQPDYESIKRFPFNQECVLLSDKDGNPTRLSCHAKGHTPLAGASYKRKKAGYQTINCGYEGEKDGQVEFFQYICTKGCDKPSVPQVLDEPYLCD